jgi:predicted flavoprotein YhiN
VTAGTCQGRSAAVIGGGPAGLMAAEILSRAGVAVTVYDQMPSVGRKLLMAGRGGLNLTHSEALPMFLARYGAARTRLAPLIEALPPEALIRWCHNLGQPIFVGSSGRVFPVAMKASPLLRAWLTRLAGQGVALRPRHR